MGFLDAVSPLSRRWRRISREATDAIFRAAAHQAQAAGIRDPAKEATRLAGLYSIERRPPRWQEFGEVAFHITVSYPPDLAYTILYSLRGCVSGVRHDPVPLILKALEEMQGFRPSHAQLNMELSGSGHDAFHDASVRAGKAAQILAREISTVPLRYASGIWAAANPRAQPFIHTALKEFNPRGAQILAARPSTWWLTPTGAVRGLLGILFGRDES